MTRDDVSKLPQWAQHRLAALTDSVEHWKAEALAAASADAQDTNVAVQMHDAKGDRGLPPDSRILFTLPNGAEIMVHHSGSQDPDGVLVIHANNDAVRVRSQSSNVVFIECLDPVNVRRRPRSRRC